MAKEATKQPESVKVNSPQKAGSAMPATEALDELIAAAEAGRDPSPEAKARGEQASRVSSRKSTPSSVVSVRHGAGIVILAKKCWYHGHVEVIQETLNVLKASHPELEREQGFPFSETDVANRSTGYADSCKEGNRQYSACRNRANAILKTALKQAHDLPNVRAENRPKAIEAIRALKAKAKEVKEEKTLPNGYKNRLAFKTRQEAETWAKEKGLDVIGE